MSAHPRTIATEPLYIGCSLCALRGEYITVTRRGDGSYETTMRAMELLQRRHCLFGMSVCYTSENVSQVTDPAFIDLMLSKGAKFGLYFNYMPVGQNAVPDLIPTPEQREHMYRWLREMRDAKTGKPQKNLELSKWRMEKAVKALTDAGVPASSITSNYYGDTIQPFAENDKNRVTIIVANGLKDGKDKKTVRKFKTKEVRYRVK